MIEDEDKKVTEAMAELVEAYYSDISDAEWHTIQDKHGEIIGFDYVSEIIDFLEKDNV